MLPIFDGHNDALLNLYLPERGGGRSFFERSDQGHVDLPRAVEGGLAGGMFAIFVPPVEPLTRDDVRFTENGYEVPLSPARDPRDVRAMTTAMLALLDRLDAESDGRFKVVRTADQIDACLKQGVLAAVIHFEGAEAIDADLDLLRVYYEAGLRSLGIVWSRPNQFAHGVPYRFPHSPDTGPGLTDAGCKLVRRCNELGILLDLSHLSEQGFWDVAKLSDAPLVATHSGAHALCPSTRNLTDRQLDAIGKSDGLVGVTFDVCNTRRDGMDHTDTPLSVIADHVDHIAGRIGIDHVAFGSDFDGAPVPDELGDVAGLPKLVAILKERGYDEESLRKVTHENWLRVLRTTWQ